MNCRKCRKKITAAYLLDHLGKYSRGERTKIPYVLASTHPRFKAGARFDFGFLEVALREGYDVEIFSDEEEVEVTASTPA